MISGKRCICVLSNLLNVMRINRDLEAKKDCCTMRDGN